MTIAAASTRVAGGRSNFWYRIGTVIASASVALVTGTCTAALVPVQLSMGRKVPASTIGAGKRTSAPAKQRANVAQDEDKRLAEALNRLSPKERKQLAKAMKRLTPEGRKQLTEVLKRQLAGKGTAPHAITKPARQRAF